MSTQTQTPRKGKRKPHHAQHNTANHQNNSHPLQAHAYQQPHITDYETDYPDIHVPPMTRTNEELNFAVLSRYYPAITQVRSIAPYAVLYQFSADAGSWVKTEIEGTLFICELTPSDIGTERFNVVILNRRGFENFEQELKSSEDIEVTTEYVILKGEQAGEDVVYGIWIFSEPDTSTETTRVVNAAMIADCAAQAETSRRAALENLATQQLALEQEQALEGNGYAAEPESEIDDPASVAMGRQLSLSDLFRKQREKDAGFSVNHHESPTLQIAQPQITQPQSSEVRPQGVSVHENAPAPQFFTTPDTDFFRSGPKFTPVQDQQPTPTALPVPVASNGGNALLEQMFRSARGHG